MFFSATLTTGQEMYTTKHLHFLASEWERVIEWEQRASEGDEACARVLADIYFLDMALARLFYECCLASRSDIHRGEDAIYIAEAVNHTFHDEKLPEDLHQHARDHSRPKRSRIVNLRCVQNCAIQSGVLESRRCEDEPHSHAVHVSDDEVAQLAWRVVHRHRKVVESGRIAPVEWPLDMNK